MVQLHYNRKLSLFSYLIIWGVNKIPIKREKGTFVIKISWEKEYAGDKEELLRTYVCQQMIRTTSLKTQSMFSVEIKQTLKWQDRNNQICYNLKKIEKFLGTLQTTRYFSEVFICISPYLETNLRKKFTICIVATAIHPYTHGACPNASKFMY